MHPPRGIPTIPLLTLNVIGRLGVQHAGVKLASHNQVGGGTCTYQGEPGEHGRMAGVLHHAIAEPS